MRYEILDCIHKIFSATIWFMNASVDLARAIISPTSKDVGHL